jgi:putative transcriptional regulator
MGLIVNKPAPGLNMQDLFKQLEISSSDTQNDSNVLFGGPVENGRGFILHSGEYAEADATLEIGPQYSMTANKDVLEAMADGRGPEQAILMLGYAGWGPGQLEQEIVQNGWLVTDATPELVFGTDNSIKWTAALKTLGIDPLRVWVRRHVQDGH